jgi:hypothetical protein
LPPHHHHSFVLGRFANSSDGDAFFDKGLEAAIRQFVSLAQKAFNQLHVDLADQAVSQLEPGSLTHGSN